MKAVILYKVKSKKAGLCIHIYKQNKMKHADAITCPYFTLTA